MYAVFHYDATPAVGFQTSGGALITNHEGIRVSYAISGGCTIDHDLKAAALGVVDDSIVFVGIYQACVLSFTAYFGASSGDVSATSANLAPETRRVVASSVVFDTSLADSPLVAGTAYAFTRESPYCLDFVAAQSSAVGRLCAALRGCNVFRILL
jgi:hypothetical protein